MVEGLKGLLSLAHIMSDIQRVFVPSVTEEDGNTIGLGVFSTEETAWSILRAFLKKSHLMSLNQADMEIRA